MEIKAGRDANIQSGNYNKLIIDNKKGKNSWQDNLVIYCVVTVLLGLIISFLVWYFGFNK